MILLILLLGLAIWATVATVVEVRRDGYRQTPTDWSRAAARSVSDAPEAGHIYR
ncbi:hypothetical protein [uncultured Microbacterium sp.]|uniref:hypothetical protein n=1 Tax=uncultured Microbacterium sp. TaxID=191216 RepID=UPI0028D25174|nr:hypothetical protein [uncultured Microbacterium sp.]